MNTKLFAGISAALVLGAALPVFAQGVGAGAGVNARVGSTTVGTNVEVRMANAKDRANQEIARRINALRALNERVQAMVRVSATVKANISSDVDAEIASLTALNAKIQGDPDFDLLRADIQSITSSYRIFVLIIPQGHIIVAADKIQTAVSTMKTFAEKLQARISAAQTSGTDVTAATASLSDMNAKLADAQAQASAAISLVADLTPDNGDKAKMTANEQALKDARAKLRTALKDLQDARKDAGDIVKALRTWTVDTTLPNTSASSSATSSVSGGTQ